MRTRPLVLPEGALPTTPPEAPIVLPEEVARYVRDVLRVRPGAPVAITDGAGWIADGRVATLDRRQVTVALEACRRAPPRRGPEVVLFQALGKGDKLETVVRQTTELGVAVVQPILTERAVPRAPREDRLRGVVEDAMRVSGRAWRPSVRPARALADVLAEPRRGPAYVLALDGNGSLSARLSTLSAPPAIELLVGPEGGLTAGEVSAAVEAGFEPTHLGPFTLRTETAGAAVVTLAVGLTGGWDE